MNAHAVFAILLVVSLATPALAAPALHKPQAAGPLPLVFPDTDDASIYYYPPGDIVLVTERDGAPDLRFLSVVYAGTQTTGDAGAFMTRSTIAFRVRMQRVDATTLRDARAALPAGSRLVALPIRRVTSNLVWTPIETPETPASLGEGRFEETNGAQTGEGSWWTERIVTLAPETFSAQALWDAFQRGRVLMSFAYAIDAIGVVSDESKDLATQTVKANTIPIEADAARWPDRFRRVDMNQGVPPGYAILSVRCYDFANETPAPIAVKRVEIRAHAVSGSPVTRTIAFRAAAPDITSATVRFPVAVRLDQPFRYRITEIRGDGTVSAGAWRVGASWWFELDVTTAGGPS